ncbi:DeoR/GlpR family DNA-binding transcription regulator [Bullifex porci]|uniref:DeoR/GlpR family DNA-binding transcription regulator n=1 Tax=Bullifex porci TaxID=2606638 RepID=UPI0023F10848|nr:DeoR/GlpR family DNA-binding transcription regulator [Bullifex porci]MDD7254640.1 DeoR/GlpR family DNA-binding transcription regulator [Bullifex porci]MDY2741859.1 DeoR/GlpR family DNA-binding transcription regulator [Bullifex porci]
MDITDRRKEIINILKDREYVTVEEFSKVLGVSTVTIRTDLSALESEGSLIRTHGGAMKSEKKSKQRFISNTMSENELEKKEIALKASSLIKDGSTIIIDSGSTTIHLAENLKDKKITVVTNNVLAQDILKNEESVNLIVLGGTLRRASMGTIGPIANNAVKSMNVDIFFLGAAAYNQEIISSYDVIEVELKKNMIHSADKVVLLADSSKYGKKAFSTISSWDLIDTFITDKIDNDFREKLEELGVEVILSNE